MPATAAAAPVGHAFRSVLLAGNVCLPRSLLVSLRLSSIHPALFVYNLNVVFVCCRSLLPAKKSLSLSLTNPQQNESSSSVAAEAAAFSDETSDFSTERSKSFYGWPLVLFGGKMRRAHLQFRRKRPKQGRIVFRQM